MRIRRYITFLFILLTSILFLQCPQPQMKYSLTVSIEPEYGGFVSPDSNSYVYGSVITLTAYSNEGFSFSSWKISEDDMRQANPTKIVITGNMIVKAVFNGLDDKIPVITRFEGPDETTEKQINIILEGTDNIGIAGWLVNESPEKPDPKSSEWDISIPVKYVFNTAGIHNLYAWAKDGSGNISISKNLCVNVIDNEQPVINQFAVPSLVNMALLSPIIDASDNFGILYWLITESSSKPETNDSDWNSSQPVSYVLSSAGEHTLYAWVKDESGNISNSLSAIVVYDDEPPLISEFRVPSSSSSYQINVLTLSGADDRGQIYWLLTSSPNPPYAFSPLWSKVKPDHFSLPSHGTNTVYAWARDDAGNVSESVSADVFKYFDGSWTLMVWLDGDNNLEPEAAADFNEMEYGLLRARMTDPAIADKLAIVVQYDRIEGFDVSSHSDKSDWTDTRRYLVKAQDTSLPYNDFCSQKLEECGEVNMGDATSLNSFILYCKRNFPADHYGLILWNHGRGVRSVSRTVVSSSTGPYKGVCSDDTNEDILYIGEVKKALTDISDVEFLGYDACYMGMAEVAYEYRGLPSEFGASYMVGTPATEQGSGWPYSNIIERLKGAGFTDAQGDECYDVGNINANTFAKVVVKEYMDEYGSYPDELITAIDLSKIEDVKLKLDTLTMCLSGKKTLCENIRGSFLQTSTLEYFNEGDEDCWIDTPHFDLYDFADELTKADTDALTKALANNLKVSIDECIIASGAGSGYTAFIPGKNGMGIFFPDGDRYSSEYKQYHYALEYWYTAEDIFVSRNQNYGNIDFCSVDSDGTVDSWKELLDEWY